MINFLKYNNYFVNNKIFIKKYSGFMGENFKKNPLNRISKHFDDELYNLQLLYATDYIEEEEDCTVFLFKVDKEKNESSIFFDTEKTEINYLPEIELKVHYVIEESENKTYNETDQQNLRYKQAGNLMFLITEKQLQEKETDIEFGDIIGVPVDETTTEYYSVFDDGKRNHDNNQTIFGYKHTFRTIECVTADDIFES